MIHPEREALVNKLPVMITPIGWKEFYLKGGSGWCGSVVTLSLGMWKVTGLGLSPIRDDSVGDDESTLALKPMGRIIQSLTKQRVPVAPQNKVGLNFILYEKDYRIQ